MVVSASQALADNFSIFCKSLIDDMELLQFLARGSTQRTSNIMFDVGPATPDPSPSVKSVGLTGQLTGSRADVIIADDIEIPKNSYTHVLRERTFRSGEGVRRHLEATRSHCLSRHAADRSVAVQQAD
jgi:hypothetical protein